MADSRPTGGCEGKLVLVADDDAAVVGVIHEALAKEGFTVVSAGNGAQCLALVASRRPDVVVMDLSMPSMSGMEALRSLRHDPQTRLLPVVIITGRTDFGSLVEGWMSGAESYLRKPLQMEVLVREVKRLAGGDGKA